MGRPLIWNSEEPVETRKYYLTKGDVINYADGSHVVNMKGADATFVMLEWSDLERHVQQAVLARDKLGKK